MPEETTRLVPSEGTSYVGPMSEDDYLATVERIQQAMAIEPFCPPLIDVVKLLSDWRTLRGALDKHHIPGLGCAACKTAG